MSQFEHLESKDDGEIKKNISHVEQLNGEEREAFEELRKRLKNTLNPTMYEDELLFYRFLKARNFDVDKAEFMLRQHLIWRKAFQVDTILEDYKPPYAYLKYIEGTYLGEDKEGCGVRYLPFGNLNVKDILNCFKWNDYVRDWTWTVESDLARLEESNKKTGRNCSKFMHIVNLDNLQLSTATHPKSTTHSIRLGNAYQDNYPERLKIYFVINAPSFFVTLHSIFKKFLDPEVMKKFHVYGRSGWQEELLKMVDADVLPGFLGGNRTDPDGNSMCNTFVKHSGRIPSEYYLSEEDRSFKDKSRVKHITVLPGKNHEIFVDVTESGSIIQWEYDVKNNNIGFGLYFKLSEQELEEILPTFKFETVDGVESSSYKCQRTGTYVIVFDNTYSWIHKKEISYCITVK